MKHLIDKDALVAEIERTQKILNLDDYGGRAVMAWSECFKNFIDTLEVKEVEDTELLKVRCYLVRDKDDYTAIYAEKPHRGKTEWVDGNNSCLMTINDARPMPDIEFEDEPVEIEVTLKRLNIEE